MITLEQISEFEKITSFPLKEFLSDVKLFFQVNYPEIVKFYKGESNFIKKENFKKLDRLLLDCERATDKFKTNKNIFNRAFFWDLCDSLEDVKIKLQTTKNSSKFLRSSLINGSSKNGLAVKVLMSKNETLEDISKKVLNSSDPDNDWIDIAIENDLKEQQWDIDGGTEIIVRKNLFQNNLVTSFIDNTVGERIYGKDINQEVKFQDNDLLSLDYKETVIQTVEILASITRNSIPEFRNMGLDPTLYVGSNYSQLNAASIGNQLRRNFNSDDLFKDFEILKIELNNGDVFIEYQVNTKLNEVLIKSVTI